MEISGHKTRSCFERYHIISLADIQESGQKMDQWMKAQRSKPADPPPVGTAKKRKVRDSGTNSADRPA
jgi:hypothetical protein